jgi:hypothetical protein
MSPTPDLNEPFSPADPAGYRPRPLLGFSFWAMMVFGLVCVAAGVAIAGFGAPLLARVHRLAAPAAAPAAMEPAHAPPPAQVTPAPTVAPPAPLADTAQLDARVAALETGEARTAQAAAAALAAAAVIEASQSSGPFAAEVAGLRAVAPPSPELADLARLAEAGAPSRAALAAGFPDYAARAASAARRPGDGASFGDRILYGLSRVVSLRRVGDVPGGAADAILARAEQAAEDGDLDRALRALDGLPPAAREAVSPWRLRAERRAQIDRDAAALRARALQSLTAPPRPPA